MHRDEMRKSKADSRARTCLRLGAILLVAAVASAIALGESVPPGGAKWVGKQNWSGHFTLDKTETIEQPMRMAGLVSVSGTTTLRITAEGSISLTVSPDDAANGYFNTFTGEDNVQVSYSRREEGSFQFPDGPTFTQIVERNGNSEGEGDAQLFLDPQGGVYSVSFHPYPIEVNVREWTEFSDDAAAELQKGCSSGLILTYCMVLQLAEETNSKGNESVSAGDANDNPLPLSGYRLTGTEIVDDDTTFTWCIFDAGEDTPTPEVNPATSQRNNICFEPK